jgi:hypothetical protein
MAEDEPEVVKEILLLDLDRGLDFPVLRRRHVHVPLRIGGRDDTVRLEHLDGDRVNVTPAGVDRGPGMDPGLQRSHLVLSGRNVPIQDFGAEDGEVLLDRGDVRTALLGVSEQLRV